MANKKAKPAKKKQVKLSTDEMIRMKAQEAKDKKFKKKMMIILAVWFVALVLLAVGGKMWLNSRLEKNRAEALKTAIVIEGEVGTIEEEYIMLENVRGVEGVTEVKVELAFAEKINFNIIPNQSLKISVKNPMESTNPPTAKALLIELL